MRVVAPALVTLVTKDTLNLVFFYHRLCSLGLDFVFKHVFAVRQLVVVRIVDATSRSGRHAHRSAKVTGARLALRRARKVAIAVIVVVSSGVVIFIVARAVVCFFVVVGVLSARTHYPARGGASRAPEAV